MTVATKFHNYQANGAPENVIATINKYGFSPNLKTIRDYLVARGWMDLGYKPNGRPIRGGTSNSTHTWGALDIRYENPGPGRAEGDHIIEFLIANSAELGVQAIHDYLKSRIWRAWRPASQGGGGWRDQRPNPSNGMGQAWANYIHIELHPDAFGDLRTVEQRTARPTPTPTPTPIPTPQGGDTVFIGIVKTETGPYSAAWSNGTTTVVPSASLNAFRSIQKALGASDDQLKVKIVDDIERRAYGPLVTVLPDWADPYGVAIR